MEDLAARDRDGRGRRLRHVVQRQRRLAIRDKQWCGLHLQAPTGLVASHDGTYPRFVGGECRGFDHDDRVELVLPGGETE